LPTPVSVSDVYSSRWTSTLPTFVRILPSNSTAWSYYAWDNRIELTFWTSLDACSRSWVVNQYRDSFGSSKKTGSGFEI